MIAFNICVPENLGVKFPIICLALWRGDVMHRYSKIWIIRTGCPCVEGDRDLPWNVLWQSKVLFFTFAGHKFAIFIMAQLCFLATYRFTVRTGSELVLSPT